MGYMKELYINSLYDYILENDVCGELNHNDCSPIHCDHVINESNISYCDPNEAD